VSQKIGRSLHAPPRRAYELEHCGSNKSGRDETNEIRGLALSARNRLARALSDDVMHRIEHLQRLEQIRLRHRPDHVRMYAECDSRALELWRDGSYEARWGCHDKALPLRVGRGEQDNHKPAQRFHRSRLPSVYPSPR